MGQDDFEQIKPTSVDLNITRSEPIEDAQHSGGTFKNGAMAIIATVVLATAAWFLLPTIFAPSADNASSSSGQPAQASATPNIGSQVSSNQGTTAARQDQPTGISPFEQAQRERERGAAKDALDSLLEIQFRLQERRVEQWAPDAYASALEQAKQGDEHYRANQFIDARDRYTDAASAMQRIEDNIPALLTRALEAGASAIKTLDSAAAVEAFNTALLIAPDNADAIAGLERANTLDLTSEAFRRGQQFENTGDEEAALAAYKEALALDGAFEPAKARINALEQARRDRNFNTEMSTAYRELSSGNPAGAIKHFNLALKLKPSSSDAKDGRAQAEFQLAQQQIDVHMKRASSAAAEERWREASDHYAKALKVDAGFAPALAGKRDSDTRSALDLALSQLADPSTPLLGDKAIQAAEKLVRSASAIPSPGPRLSTQLTAATAAIKQAQTPVPVMLRSDGLTDVTVFRVRHMGSFESEQLALKPGDYIAVGQRVGYRDVRVEFSIRAGEQSQPVEVSCTRRI